MAANDEVLENMDKAATLAEEELKDISVEHIIAISNWWKKNYIKAGHKRLAKVILKYADKKETY